MNFVRSCLHHESSIVSSVAWYSILHGRGSRCTRWLMLGSARADTLSYSAVKLCSKNSNLCDHGT